jgi:DNA repair protein RadC
LEELLAVILGSGGNNADVTVLASRVAEVLRREPPTYESLLSIKGMGPGKVTSVLAAMQLSDALSSQLCVPHLRDAARVYESCQDLLREPQEHFVAFFLSARSQQISRITLTIGTATASLVHPREVFRPAIEANASYVVVAHNHPSGDPAPSQADIDTTRRLSEAGIHLGIQLVDHVVCATEGFVSLRMVHPEVFQ